MTEVHPVLSHCEILEWEYNEHEHQLSGVKSLEISHPMHVEKITQNTFPTSCFIR